MTSIPEVEDTTINLKFHQTLNPKSETRNPKPETQNPKPETQNPKPKTRNPKPHTARPRRREDAAILLAADHELKASPQRGGERGFGV